mmetsp:Transcript_4734/g.4884  ORF Transcript_4734/g.4884 Transcript_4734/m.4884 type:complete len:126 (-) Transcript_4734:329-706(-)
MAFTEDQSETKMNIDTPHDRNTNSARNDTQNNQNEKNVDLRSLINATLSNTSPASDMRNEEKSKCELLCQKEQRLLVACVDSMRPKSNESNESNEQSEGKQQGPSCLGSSLSAWSKCCSEAENSP